MRTVAIVQARMGSSRLPGKILMPLGGEAVISRILGRLARCSTLSEVMVATTVKPDDDVVAAAAAAGGVRCFRGSETDVLGRYLGAAREAEADIIVRITADCPMVMPTIVDRVVGQLNGGDFCSNAIRRTYPKGLDVEAMHRDVLERVARMAHSPYAREHVCPFIYSERPELFVIHEVRERDDYSSLRWTLDVMEDYRHLSELVSRCEGDDLEYRVVLDRDL